MTDFVLGFAFDPNFLDVMMIYKKRPNFLKFQFNGVGGKIEEGETPEEAMVRECKEETSLNLLWSPMTKLQFADAVVYVFATTTCELYEYTDATDEPIVVLQTYSLPDNTVFNCKWLIPMIIDSMRSGLSIPEVITYKPVNIVSEID